MAQGSNPRSAGPAAPAPSDSYAEAVSGRCHRKRRRVSFVSARQSVLQPYWDDGSEGRLHHRNWPDVLGSQSLPAPTVRYPAQHSLYLGLGCCAQARPRYDKRGRELKTGLEKGGRHRRRRRLNGIGRPRPRGLGHAERPSTSRLGSDEQGNWQFFHKRRSPRLDVLLCLCLRLPVV
jgi:hypothetical protein